MVWKILFFGDHFEKAVLSTPPSRVKRKSQTTYSLYCIIFQEPKFPECHPPKYTNFESTLVTL